MLMSLPGSSMLSHPGTLITILTGIVALLSGIFKGYGYVPQGSAGMIFRFGKARQVKRKQPDGTKKLEYLIVRPGFVLLIPFVDRVESQHVVRCEVRTSPRTVMFQNEDVFDTQAFMVFNVSDEQVGVPFALCSVQNFDDQVIGILENIIAKSVSNRKSYTTLDELLAIITKRANKHFKELGIRPIMVSLPQIAPTWATQLKYSSRTGTRPLEFIQDVHGKILAMPMRNHQDDPDSAEA